MALGATLGGLVVIGGTAFAEREAAETTTIPFEGLKTFSEVYGRIRQDYVEPVPDSKLLEDSIRGMLSVSHFDPNDDGVNSMKQPKTQLLMVSPQLLVQFWAIWGFPIG